MPRERLRDYDRETRLTHEARLLGNPGATGRAKIGGAGRGGGAVSSAPAGGPGRGTEIHHITLGAVASRTIAAGGGTVQWGTVAAAPTEVRGFPSALAELAESGVIGAIPVDITGLRKWFAHLIFADEITATVTISRVRDGVETTIEEFEGTGDQWIDGSSLMVRPGDTTRVTVTTPTATTLTWGRIFVDDFGASGPTTTQRPATVYAQDQGWTTGGDWPDADAEFLWTSADSATHDAEDAWFAQTFWLAEAATVRVWFAVDNEGELFVDGTSLLTDSSGTLALGNVKDTVALDAGRHTIAVAATNVDAASPAAIRVAAYTYVGGADDTLLVHTDTDWYGWSSEPVGWPDPTLAGGG